MPSRKTSSVGRNRKETSIGKKRKERPEANVSRESDSDSEPNTKKRDLSSKKRPPKRQKKPEKPQEPKKVPRTLENTRESDETTVDPEDLEVLEDEKTDEFASYHDGKTPNMFVTTSIGASKRAKAFAKAITPVFGKGRYYHRKKALIKSIVEVCKKRTDYTDIVIVCESRETIQGLTVIHLPDGPTAYFKLSSLRFKTFKKGHLPDYDYRAEVILNNFKTRLGHTVGRMLGSLFPQDPEFEGRRVATFHNQRDFIFFRHHRYIFDGSEKVRIQELGPRFTLKLQWLQHGTFDPKNGEFEFKLKQELVTSRRRFFL